MVLLAMSAAGVFLVLYVMRRKNRVNREDPF